MSRKSLLTTAMLIMFSGPSHAETLKNYCVRLGEAWQSSGDLDSGCQCFVDAIGEDDSLAEEFRGFEANFSGDPDAYAASSAGIKAAYEKCGYSPAN